MHRKRKTRASSSSRSKSMSLDESPKINRRQKPIIHNEEEEEEEDLQQIQTPKVKSPISIIVVDESQSQSQDAQSIEEEIRNPIAVEDDKDEVLKEKDDYPLQITEEETQDRGKGEDFEGDADKGGDLQTEIEKVELKENETDESEGMNPSTTVNLINVTRRAPKRKKNFTRQSLGLGKKLKQEAQVLVSIEEDKEGNTDLIEDEKDDLKEGDNSQHQHSENDQKDPDFEPDLERESDQEDDEEKQKDEQEKSIESEEPQGMDLSPPLHVPPVDEGHMLDLVLDNQPTATNFSRKAPMKKNKKKKYVNPKKREAAEKKLELVKKNLQPIPFVPLKTLDFAKHEDVLKRLGLWEFVNMEFDKDIRSDLLALLIVNYTPSLRCSEVNGCRLKVSRADLARALNLPVKKEKNVSSEISNSDSEAFSEESISFIVEFLNQWLLPSDEAWILPKDVLNAEELIKKGKPHKVDWPGLIWSMVEKEITKIEDIGALYYASHIQCLIRSQREELFMQVPSEDGSMDEDEVSVDLKMHSLEDQGQEDEKEQIELSLGQTTNENENENENENDQTYRDEDVMDYKDCKAEPSGQLDWLLDRKSDLSLRRCNVNQDHTLESRDIMKEEAEDEQGYDPQSNSFNMGGLAPTEHLQDIGATNITYSSSFRQSSHHPSGGMFDSGIDIHLNTGGTSMFPDAFNRELSHDDIVHHKLMSNDASPMDFDHVMGEINRFTRIAAGMYHAKGESSRMNEAHRLNDLQQQNDDLINHLRRTQWESEQKDKEMYKLENELNLMTKLLGGYKKALQENRRAFLEYRGRNPKPEEPLYKDVGSGGLVLSIMEIERQRLHREEEERMQHQRAQQVIEAFELECCEKFQSHANAVLSLQERLTCLVETVKVIKETYANSKMVGESVVAEELPGEPTVEDVNLVTQE